MGKTGIKVYAPASVANFGAGLYFLSAAVEQPGDELIATLDPSIRGIIIEKITGYKKGLSLEPELNSASLAGQLLLDKLGEKRGIRFSIHKKIPLQSGLSSQAASAVAGAFAVNELLGRPFERYDLIGFAEQAAQKFNIRLFPAQVASILFGGIILYRPEVPDNFQKIYCPDGIQLSLVIPSLSYAESEKLHFLENSDNLDSRIREQGNTASMIGSLYTSDFNLFASSLQQNPPDPGLRKAYAYFDPIAGLTREKGGFGCGFCGLGPAVYIASPNTLIADEIEQGLGELFRPFKMEYQVIQTRIDLNGVYKF
jgi:homoserine kinase